MFVLASPLSESGACIPRNFLLLRGDCERTSVTSEPSSEAEPSLEWASSDAWERFAHHERRGAPAIPRVVSVGMARVERAEHSASA